MLHGIAKAYFTVAAQNISSYVQFLALYCPEQGKTHLNATSPQMIVVIRSEDLIKHILYLGMQNLIRLCFFSSIFHSSAHSPSSPYYVINV